MNKNIYAIALVKKEILHNKYFILVHATTVKEAYEFVIVQFKKNPQYKKYKFDNANKLYFVVPETENNKDMITYYPISTIILDEILSMLCRKE
jgi:hypothetical protein